MTKASKKHITQAVYKLIEPPPKYTLDEAFTFWWKDVSKNKGYRLTGVGDIAFTKAEVESYSFLLDLPPQINYFSHLLMLHEVFTTPYYIYKDKGSKDVKIKVYDSRIAMLIGLYGSVYDYCQQVSKNKGV